jgi:large subunit ribosomal protein L49
LLGKKLIPVPTSKAEYPSGWKPQDPEKYKELPYYIKRSRNHLLPVYLAIHFRGMRRRTYVRNIEGNIWQAEKDLVGAIQARIGNLPVFTQINEMNRYIIIKGDYVTLLQKFLYAKGL